MECINYLLVNSDISLISLVFMENTIASTKFTNKERAKDMAKTLEALRISYGIEDYNNSYCIFIN